MKKLKYLIALILAAVMALTSCSLFDSKDDTPTTDPITTVNNNTITINADSGNVAYASSLGLRSAVSVYCTFTATVSGGSYWNPIPQTKSYYSAGSGVIYTAEENGSAFIITNYHVVHDDDSNTENHVSDKIYVYLYGMEYEEYAIAATYVGGSASYDIAVLRVENSSILKTAFASGSAAAVTVSESNSVYTGITCIAIGNPSSSSVSGISVTGGIVSVDSEYITMSVSDEVGNVKFRVVRTDAAVNSGNSGGGLFNTKGELIGIVNAKINSTSIENIAYAIPSSVASGVANNIIANCYGKDCESVMRCIIGVTLSIENARTEYDSESGILTKIEDVTVTAVTSGSLAEGKICVSDVIKTLQIDGKAYEITRSYNFVDAMLNAKEGSEIVVTLLRDGTEQSVSFTVTADSLTAT